MNLSAQNPGERVEEAAAGSTGTQQITTEDTAPQTSLHPTPTIRVSSSQPSSSRSRLAAAWLLIATAVLVGVLVQGELGDQPTKLLTLMGVFISAVAASVEATAVFRRFSSVRTPFLALPFLGVALVIISSVSVAVTDPARLSTMSAVAPLLAASAMLFGRAFSIRGANLGRSDFSYLFPRSIDTIRDSSQGAAITVKPGDLASVDMRIVRGSVAVDERVVSTVPTFRIREEQEPIYSGSEILGGGAEAIALSSTQDSSLQQLQVALAPMIEEAQSSLRREDASAARGTALALVFVAAAAAISWNERTPGLESSLLAAGVVLLGGCICQVSDLLYGLRRNLVQRWLARGLVLSSAQTCKQLAGISQIVIDPSRIAAGSRYLVTHLEVLDDRLSASALCDCLASLLGRAESPELVAAGEYCRRHAGRLSVERVLDLREYGGRGICGTVHGIELSVGNEDFLVERGIMVQPSDGDVYEDHQESMVLVAIDDDVVARFWISTHQEHLVVEDPLAAPHGIPTRISTGIAQELGADTLLVRGHESDLVGQIARNDVAIFSPKEAEIRRSTVLALTPELGEIADLVADCRSHCRLVERTRILVGFSGLVIVASVFAGLLTPAVPLVMVLLVVASLRLS